MISPRCFLIKRFPAKVLLNYLCFLVFTINGQTAFGQHSRQLYDSVAGLVKDAYNVGDAHKVYLLTAPAYRERMSEIKFTTGLNVFSVKAGHWQDITFESDSLGGLAYIAKFEHVQQVFFLELNPQGKILRFNFSAFPLVKQTKQHLVPSNNPLLSSVDSLVEKQIRPYIQKGNTAGLCIGVIKDGRIYRYSYGETKKLNKQLPDPDSTIFEIGSLTKTFTSLLLANEIVNGGMKINVPINRYLPDSIPPLSYHGKPITLQNLANHTSGLPRLPANIFKGNIDPSDPYQHYNAKLLYSFLVHYQLRSKPGKLFSYSNYGAGLLGEVIACKAHTTFESLIVNRICLPLGMKNTAITLKESEGRHLAQGYNEKGEASPPWHLASLQGSGAISSTLNDMIKYVQAQMGKANPLEKAIWLSHQTTFVSKENTIGLAWRIEHFQNHTHWHHSGGTGGFRSFAGFDTQRQLGVIILSNSAEDVTGLGEVILRNHTVF